MVSKSFIYLSVCKFIVIRQFYIMQIKIEAEEEVDEEMSSQASLAIDKLESAFEQNENQIYLMEKFIKGKASEIATLQEYLIGEFQAMQNTKARNKRIQKILVSEVVPMLKQIASNLRKFQDYLAPYASVATAYISMLAIKAQELLSLKQEVIDQQAKTIQQLHQKVLLYSKGNRSEQQQKPNSQIYQKIQQANLSGKGNRCNHQIYLIDQKIKKIEKQFTPNREKSIKSSICQKDQSKETSKSPTKINKYEECYQNILEKKKFINYRCERPLSPLQTNVDLHRRQQKNKQESVIAYERKQCIKQKIEKIKIRTQCKEKKTKFAFYENNH